MPKSEIRKKPEIRNPKRRRSNVRAVRISVVGFSISASEYWRSTRKRSNAPVLRISDFGIRISFGFRISEFGFIWAPQSVGEFVESLPPRLTLRFQIPAA